MPLKIDFCNKKDECVFFVFLLPTISQSGVDIGLFDMDYRGGSDNDGKDCKRKSLSFLRGLG